MFNHFNEVLGNRTVSTVSLDFHCLGIPTADLGGTDFYFTEEVWQTIQDMPLDKVPGPDSFISLLYRTAWPIIKHNIMRTFHALWSLNSRSLHLVNQAYMILLRKKPDALSIADYCPISLIHSFSKLFAKVLETRLAPKLHHLMGYN